MGKLDFLKYDKKWKHYFSEAPDMFHVTYYWDSEISYFVHNSEVSCEWIEKINENSCEGAIQEQYIDGGRGWREWGLWALGAWHKYKRTKRLKNFDLVSILVCPECKGSLEEVKEFFICNSCKIKFNALPNPDFCNPVESNAICVEEA